MYPQTIGTQNNFSKQNFSLLVIAKTKSAATISDVICRTNVFWSLLRQGTIYKTTVYCFKFRRKPEKSWQHATHHAASCFSRKLSRHHLHNLIRGGLQLIRTFCKIVVHNWQICMSHFHHVYDLYWATQTNVTFTKTKQMLGYTAQTFYTKEIASLCTGGCGYLGGYLIILNQTNPYILCYNNDNTYT